MKTLLAELQKRSHVSAEDKALVKTLLAELPEGEEKTEVAPVAAEVEAKPEPEVAPAVADAAAIEAGNLAEKAKLEALTEKNRTLTEKVERMELSEEAKTMMVGSKKSDTGAVTGFVGADMQLKVVDFMLSLTQEQRGTFKTLVNAIQTVDLATKGKATGAPEPDGDEPEEGEEEDAKVAKYAKKILESGKAKDIEEAQKMAFKKFKGEADGEEKAKLKAQK